MCSTQRCRYGYKANDFVWQTLKEAFVYARPKDSYQTFVEVYSTQLTVVLPGRMLQEVH